MPIYCQTPSNPCPQHLAGAAFQSLQQIIGKWAFNHGSKRQQNGGVSVSCMFEGLQLYLSYSKTNLHKPWTYYSLWHFRHDTLTFLAHVYEHTRLLLLQANAQGGVDTETWFRNNKQTASRFLSTRYETSPTDK
jgi:hypothetical protein